MASFVTVPPKVASVVSTEGISPLTVMVWVCSPGCSTKSTRTFFPTSTSTPLCSSVRKPLAVARTVYVPGSRAGVTYWPAPSATKFRVTPRATSVTVTMAPAMAPPVWSNTPP